MTSEVMPPEMMVVCHSCGGETVDYTELVTETCEECDGIGDLEEVPCPVCEGGGCPRCFEEGKLYNVVCPECDGQGTRDYHPKCPSCRGTGWHPHPGFME